jgi:hypothetical protein
MQRTYKKQTVADFRQRVKRVDPAFAVIGEAAYARPTVRYRPLVSLITGAGWLYLVGLLLTDPGRIPISLQLGSLPEQLHMLVMALPTALIITTALILPVHLARALLRFNPRHKNARMILLGAIVGGTLAYLPDDSVMAGLDYLHGPGKDGLLIAQSKALNGLSWLISALTS